MNKKRTHVLNDINFIKQNKTYLFGKWNRCGIYTPKSLLIELTNYNVYYFVNHINAPNISLASSLYYFKLAKKNKVFSEISQS